MGAWGPLGGWGSLRRLMLCTGLWGGLSGGLPEPEFLLKISSSSSSSSSCSDSSSCVLNLSSWFFKVSFGLPVSSSHYFFFFG